MGLIFDNLIHKTQQEGLEKEITRRSLTHTAWDLSVSKDNERRGWHPVTYKFSDATSQLIHSIKVMLTPYLLTLLCIAYSYEVCFLYNHLLKMLE